jgi:hypothetical protein
MTADAHPRALDGPLGRRKAEKHRQGLFPTDGTHELATGAVDEKQDDQPELDDPKVGSYHLLDHLAARGDDVPPTPPDGDEVLQVVNHECADHADERFPDERCR